MRILALANNLKPDSGWGRYSLAVVREFKRRKFDLLVLTESAQVSFEGEKNILIPPQSLFKILKNIIIVRQLAKDYEIIHAFDGFPYAIYGYFAVLGRRQKLFINGVGSYSVAPFNNFLKKWFLKLAYKKAKKIFCISNYTKKKILEKVKCQAITVFLGRPEIPRWKKVKYGLAKNFPIFLTVGEIKPRKGQLNSLQAIARLSKQYPNFRYFIVGNSGDQKYYQAILDFIAKNNLQKNIKIISGLTADLKLAFFYSISDIFIMTSVNGNDHFEGFGLVFLEANQFGKPAIGSLDCGIEDAIKDGFTGFLVKQNDIEDIYEKIIKLLKLLKEEPERIKKNCLEFSQQFSWQKTVDIYLKYY